MSKPDGFHSITPYVRIRDAAAAIEFYKKAFGASQLMCESDDQGKVRHAEIQIGDSQVMITDETTRFPELRSVQAYGGSPVNLFLYVDDADAVAKKALEAGATLMMEVQNQSYGRSGGVKDPFGLIWWVCS